MSIEMRIHSRDIWGPNWKRAEAILQEWMKYICTGKMEQRTPSLDSGVEKARSHPNPQYRK